MAAIQMDEVLKKIGWTDGTKIPIANSENTVLEEEITKLLNRRHKAAIASENSENRFKALNKHLRFLNDESEQNQKLIAAYKEQLEHDQHKYRLKQCERDKTRTDSKSCMKASEETEERQEQKKTTLQKGMLKIEKLKAEAAWDAEALKAWEEALKKRDEDNELLKKFSKEDEKKAKDLESKRLSLQIEANRRKEMIRNMIAELKNYEQILERTDKMLKQLKDEKATLIRQWQETVRNLRQRDEDIRRVNKELETAQDVLAMQNASIEEQNTFLKNEIKNNRELAEQIEIANMQNSKVRRDLNHGMEAVLSLNNELSTLKRTLLSTAQKLEKERARSKILTKDLSFKECQIQKLHAEIKKLEDKHEEITNSFLSAAERAKQLEVIIEYEQKQTNVLAVDLAKVQNVLYRTQQLFYELKELAKTKGMEISGYHLSMNILRRHKKKITIDLERQREMIYDLEYRKCNLESKLALLEGTVTDDLLEEVVTKIKDLQATMAKHNEIKNLLQGQITRLSDEMRRLTNKIAADNVIIEDLRNKLQNHVLLYEGGLKQAAAAKLLSQKKQVEENILRLKVDNLSKGMVKEEKQIYNLQKFRLELDTAMKERQIEIKANKEILMAKRKNLDEELGRLRADIMGRNIKITHLQSRYHVSMSLLGKDEDGQPLSLTHFKLKTAQEKYLLQTTGDDLDIKIKTAEKEIVAMENTLKVVNYTNATYKNSLAPVHESDDAVKLEKTLKQQLQDVEITLRDKKKLLKLRSSDIKGLQNMIDARNDTRNELLAILKDLECDIDHFDREKADRIMKIQRTNKYLGRTNKQIQRLDIHLELKDFETRNLQNCNYSAMQQLKEMSSRHPEVAPVLTRYFDEIGLSTRGSLVRSRTSSCSDDALASFYSSSSHRSSGEFGAEPVTLAKVTLSLDYQPHSKTSVGSKSTIPTIAESYAQREASRLQEEKLKLLRRPTLSSMYTVTKEDIDNNLVDAASINLSFSMKLHKAEEESISIKTLSTGDSIHVPSCLFQKTTSELFRPTSDLEDVEEESDITAH